jgi:hypothetical protein
MTVNRTIASFGVLLFVGFTLSLIVATTGHTRSSSAHTGSVATCEATHVHYERFHGPGPAVGTLPWIVAAPRSTGLVGHLFYYDAHNPWKQRQLPLWRIYTGGESPNGRVSMKILWSAPRPVSDASVLVVRGTRLGRPLRFSQTLDVGPSIVTVPVPGCWRLTLRAGSAITRLTVLALK